jgi:hypothetical protein
MHRILPVDGVAAATGVVVAVASHMAAAGEAVAEEASTVVAVEVVADITDNFFF